MHIVSLVYYLVGQSPSSEGIFATKLPNGDAQVTCADSDVVCLVLFQSTINLDRILVALIDSFASSMAFSVSDTFANGHVIVYSWNSSVHFRREGITRSLGNSIHQQVSACIWYLKCLYSLLCCVHAGAPSTLSPTDPPPVSGSQFPLATRVIAGKANSIKCLAKVTHNYYIIIGMG